MDTIKKFGLELISWTLSIVIALFIFAVSFVDAQDTRGKVLTTDRGGNMLVCVTGRPGVTVCTVVAKSTTVTVKR